MTIEYSVIEIDFLNYSLFSASQNKRIMNQKRRSWLLLTVGFLIIAILFYKKNDSSFYFYLAFAVVTFTLYPLYQKKYYKKHYKKYVIDTYKARFGETITVIFNDDHVETKSLIGEGTINYSVIEQIDETGEYFFLKLKTGGALIIPKREINELSTFTYFLETLAQKNNWNKYVNLGWKW